MDTNSILDEVKNICDEIFEDHMVEIDENTLLIDDLGCDSLKKLIFINELEARFNISIKLDDSLKMNKISDVCRIVKESCGN